MEAMKKAVGLSVSQAPKNQEFIEICAALSDSPKDEVQARAEFYAAVDPERLRYYVPQESKELFACQLVSLLTNLPPLWIFDHGTNREGSLSEGFANKTESGLWVRRDWIRAARQ